MIQTLSDVGAENKITNKMDGAVYSLFGDCVIQGVGDEFEENHGDLTITINSGEAILCGHFFKLTGSETIDILPNSTGFVCLSIDVTRPNGNRGYLSYKSLNDVKYENINGNGTVRDLPIYRISTNASSITSISDNRVIKNSQGIPNVEEKINNAVSAEATARANAINTRLDSKTLKVLTQAQYNALGTKDANTIYFIVG